MIAAVTLALGLPGSTEPLPLATGELVPYVSESLPHAGPVAEIVFSAARKAGLEPALSFLPWVRAESEMAAGRYFAAFPCAMTEDRVKSGYLFSSGLLQFREVIVYLDGAGKDFAWTTMADFKPYRMGGVPGYNYMEEFRKAGITPVATESVDRLVMMLRSGRIDYFIEDELVASAAIRGRFPGEETRFRYMAKPYLQSSLRMMASPDYPGSRELLARFDAGLASMRADGSLAAILSRAGMAATRPAAVPRGANQER